MQDHVFVYRYDEIFSLAELKFNKGSIHELSTLRKMVTTAIRKRFRIREVPDILNLNHLQQRMHTSQFN